VKDWREIRVTYFKAHVDVQRVRGQIRPTVAKDRPTTHVT